MGEVQEKALANLQTQVNTRMNSLQKQYDVDCTEYRKAHDAWRAANPELAAAPPPQGQEGQLKEGERRPFRPFAD